MELTKIMTFCNNQKIKFKVLCNEIGVTDVEINTTPINNIPSKDLGDNARNTDDVPVKEPPKEKDMAALIQSIANVFKTFFDSLMFFCEYFEYAEKQLIEVTEMDNSKVMKKTIDEIRSELSATKSKKFDNTLQKIAECSNRRHSSIIREIGEKNYITFLKNISPSDIECWYNCGIINEEIKAFILAIGYKQIINWNKEPFINSFRQYILQDNIEWYDYYTLRFSC